MRRASTLLSILLFTVVACRTAPAPSARKVVMLSLDGADATTLHQLHREGRLTAGGFARFFAEGQVAEGLLPANPTITASNHISLATGFPAGDNGIVGNTIRLPGMPLTKTVSGFAAEIQTETLWEAARRQGLRVAISAWPGADNRGSRRRGDWGMTYTNDPEHGAELVTLPRSEWKHPLKEGEWGLVPCRADAAARCWTKVLDQDGDRVRVYFGGRYVISAYPAEFERRLRSELVWPGPPDGRALDETWAGRPGIDLETWTEQDERFAAFFTDVILAAAGHAEWDLLMGYSPVLDEAGHKLLLADPRQPGFSPERRDALGRARVRIWQAVDRELARLLAAMDLRTTTVLVVSDHGMTPTHTRIDLDALLRDWGLLHLGSGGRIQEGSRADAIGGGGICHIYLQPGLPEAERARILDDLRARLGGWRIGGDTPVERIVTREEAGEVGLGHPNSGDLILFAAPGYSFQDDNDPVVSAVMPTPTYGKHGYAQTYPAMRGVYLAVGAGVRKGSGGTVSTLDVAGRVADWLGIEKPRREPPATASAP